MKVEFYGTENKAFTLLPLIGYDWDNRVILLCWLCWGINIIIKKNMTQEDKELLLRDLCARLPYGVVVKHPYGFGKLESITKEGSEYDFTFDTHDDNYYKLDKSIKPYLRPMSSMTEEEDKEICQFMKDYNLLPGSNKVGVFCGEIVDWLNAHHFDYRGLIEKGLAIAVTEENNPYK